MPSLDRAFGYQDNPMALPVPNLDDALPFYENVLGFRVESREETPHRSAVLTRDLVKIGLAENGGDPSQDGCAFHVTGLDDLVRELQGRGFSKGIGDIGTESHDSGSWRVFYVVAPDGLCFWFGERC